MTVEELFAAVLDVPREEVGDDTTPHNTGSWTSRTHLQLVVAMEDVYQVSLSAAEIKSMTSVAAVRTLLADKGALIS